jgi:tRNA G18 (ribose-2'-O)-methylase SpoU
MPRIDLHTLNDSRLAPYRLVKEKLLLAGDGRFIAEGEFVVRRLLTSTYECESVLCANRKAAALSQVVPPSIPMYVLDEQLINQLLGFQFHGGVMPSVFAAVISRSTRRSPVPVRRPRWWSAPT